MAVESTISGPTTPSYISKEELPLLAIDGAGIVWFVVRSQKELIKETDVVAIVVNTVDNNEYLIGYTAPVNLQSLRKYDRAITLKNTK